MSTIKISAHEKNNFESLTIRVHVHHTGLSKRPNIYIYSEEIWEFGSESVCISGFALWLSNWHPKCELFHLVFLCISLISSIFLLFSSPSPSKISILPLPYIIYFRNSVSGLALCSLAHAAFYVASIAPYLFRWPYRAIALTQLPTQLFRCLPKVCHRNHRCCQCIESQAT